MCLLCYKWEPNTEQNMTNAITIVLVPNYRQGVRVTDNILPHAHTKIWELLWPYTWQVLCNKVACCMQQ